MENKKQKAITLLKSILEQFEKADEVYLEYEINAGKHEQEDLDGYIEDVELVPTGEYWGAIKFRYYSLERNKTHTAMAIKNKAN